MNFLKTLFWIVVTVIAVVFATSNWSTVTLNLWAGLQADAKLPILLLLAFLIGFLPTWLWHRGRLWQVRRQAATGGVVPPAPAPHPAPYSAAASPVAAALGAYRAPSPVDPAS